MVGKKIAIALVAGVALISMAGCTQGPSAAAVVGGHVITESYLRDVVDANPILRDDPNERMSTETAEVLTYLIWSAYFDQLFPLIGEELSDQELEGAWMANIPQDNFLFPLFYDERTAEAIKGLIDYSYFSMLAEQGSINSAAYVAAAMSIQIELNPRYGTWDPMMLRPSVLVDDASGGPLAERQIFTIPS